MNAPDTSAGGGPSQPQPRPEDEVAAAALPETAAEAEPAIPGLAERAIARWENEGGAIHQNITLRHSEGAQSANHIKDL